LKKLKGGYKMAQKGRIRTISFILYTVLVLCLIFATLSGFTFLPLSIINTDTIPLFILSTFYIIWYISILYSFLLPIIKRLQEEKGKESSDILFGSGTLLVFASLSLIVVFFSTISYLFYIGVRTGNFHS